MEPNSEVETASVAEQPVIAALPKAVLKHTQSKRWREFRCGHANAERLDCVRFIAAFTRWRDKSGCQVRNSA